jgi:CRP-like cAMP-binding protein
MKVQYFLADDAIINAGDCSREVYIVLQGEVKVTDISSQRVLSILGEGNYFGEANVIYNLMGHRTANVIAQRQTKVGVIDENSFIILIEAYPQWANMLKEKADKRLKEALGERIFSSLKQRIREIPTDAPTNAPT